MCDIFDPLFNMRSGKQEPSCEEGVWVLEQKEKACCYQRSEVTDEPRTFLTRLSDPGLSRSGRWPGCRPRELGPCWPAAPLQTAGLRPLLRSARTPGQTGTTGTRVTHCSSY